MLKKIWIAVFGLLILGLVFALVKSPFIHSQGPFAQFEQDRAIPALISGMIGTLILMIAGWILLKRGTRND